MPKRHELHPELQSFFHAHQAKTCGCKRACHDQLGALMTMCDEVDAHLNDLLSKLTQAEMAAHDGALDGKMEWMHTRIQAAKTRSANFRREGRDLARVLVEVEESFSQDVIDLNIMLSVRGADGTVATPGPAIALPSVPAV